MATALTQTESIKPVDTNAAEAFEKFLVPPIFGPWSHMLVDHAGVGAGERVLDIGCGTGAAARYTVGLVGQAGRVVATDIDAGMIAYARTLEGADLVEWRQDNVLDLPYEDDGFDVIVGNQVLQFLPDKPKALSEMRRVLTADGRLALSIYCGLDLCPAHAAVARALEAHDVDPAGIENPYAYGDPMVLGDVVQAAGFRDVSVVRKTLESRFASPEKFVEALAAGGPSARHALKQLDAAGLKAVIDEVGTTLADYVDSDGLRVLTTVNMVLAQNYVSRVFTRAGAMAKASLR